MKLILSDHNRVLDDLRHHHETRETSLLGAQAAVVCRDWKGIERDISMFCKSVGVPTLSMQSGFRSVLRYCEVGKDNGKYPQIAETSMVWGEWYRNKLIEAGFSPETVVEIGCPILDHLPESRKGTGTNVLFFPDKGSVYSQGNFTIHRALLENSQYNLTTKLLCDWPGEKKYSRMHEKFGGLLIVTDPDSERHYETIAELLGSANVVVVQRPCTAALFAVCADIPVVIADVEKKRASVDSRNRVFDSFANGCSLVENIDDLCPAVDRLLENPEQSDEQRAEAARNFAGANLPGTVLDRMLETVRTAVDYSRRRSTSKIYYSKFAENDLVEKSENLIEMFLDKGDRAFRKYAQRIMGTGTARVMESVYGFNYDYVVALVPRDFKEADLPFSAESEVSGMVGRNTSPVHLDEMKKIVYDSTLDVVFDTNYPQSTGELKAKAAEYFRILKKDGELHLFMRNPRALKSRVREGLGMEDGESACQAPSVSELLESFEKAGLGIKTYEAVHPSVMNIEVKNPNVRRKVKIIGSVYRMARTLAPDSVASFYTAVFVK